MGRPKGSRNKSGLAVADFARGLVDDPVYQANLRKRIREGKCPPAVEAMFWHYAYGKPAETVNLRTPEPVRVVHEYAARPPDSSA